MRKLSAEKKMLLVLAFIVILTVTMYLQFSQPSSPQQEQYPQNVAGIIYPNPMITQDGNVVSIPQNIVNSSKLVFLDLKLRNQTASFTYQGRTVPLFEYREGEYLPLIVISTPNQKVISGIRVCEPCASFSFHIVQGMYLDCDRCHTQWNVETFTGISGGCQNYPPPKLASSVGENVDIDLSSLGMIVTL